MNEKTVKTAAPNAASPTLPMQELLLDCKAVFEVAERVFSDEKSIFNFQLGGNATAEDGAAKGLLKPSVSLSDYEQKLMNIFSLLQENSTAVVLRQALEVVFARLRRTTEEEALLIETCKEVSFIEQKVLNKICSLEVDAKRNTLDYKRLRADLENNLKVIAEQQTEEEEAMRAGTNFARRIENGEAVFRAEINSLREELETKAAERETVRGELTMLKSQQLKQQQALLEENEELSSKVVALQKEIESARQALVELRDQAGEAQKGVEELELQREHLIEQERELKVQTQTEHEASFFFADELKRLQAEGIAAEAQGVAAEKEQQRLREQISAARVKTAATQKDLSRTKDKNSKQGDHLEALARERNHRNTQLTELALREKAEGKKLRVLSRLLEEFESKKLQMDEELLTARSEAEAHKELAREALCAAEDEERVLAFEARQQNEVGRFYKERQEELHGKTAETLQLRQHAKRIENELGGARTSLRDANAQTAALRLEQQRYAGEVSLVHARFYKNIEELKIKCYALAEFQRRNAKAEKRLKQQRKLYDAVRYDRNVYLKSLVEIKEEIAGLRHGYNTLRYQIDQQHEESRAKTLAVLALKRVGQQLGQESNETRRKEKSSKEEIAMREPQIAVLQAEIARLKELIAEATIEKKKRLAVRDCIGAERDQLSSQFFRRSRELRQALEAGGRAGRGVALSRKFLERQRVTLQRDQRETERRRNECEQLRQFLRAHYPLKLEMIVLHRQRLHALLLMTTFRRRLEVPVNVHRWRRLQAVEPERFALILELQQRQRVLLSKTAESDAQRQAVEDRERTLFQLQNAVERSRKLREAAPGAPATLALTTKAAVIREMAQELVLCRDSANRLTVELEILDRRTRELVAGYFARREGGRAPPATP